MGMAGADHASATAGAPAVNAVDAVNVDAANVARDVVAVAVDAAELLVASLFVDKRRTPLGSLCVGVALGVAALACTLGGTTSGAGAIARTVAGAAVAGARD